MKSGSEESDLHAEGDQGCTVRLVTVSVDDGHPSDLRTAELLSHHSLKATFYVPIHNRSRPVMTDAELRVLSEAFEVGGHTVNHQPLTGMSPVDAWREIREGKERHEQLLGRPLAAFCYPMGKENKAVKQLVHEAGFAGARTCMLNRFDVPHDPYAWGVTTQAYSHPRVVQLRHALLERNFRGAWNFLRVQRSAKDWETHFRLGLDYVERWGGIAHLYLHSWEIDENRDWPKLARVLSDISERRDLRCVTNGELFLARSSFM